MCVGDGGGGGEGRGRSHGCKSTPDSVNVSEIQPSMEGHECGACSSPNCRKTHSVLEHVHGIHFVQCE